MCACTEVRNMAQNKHKTDRNLVNKGPFRHTCLRMVPNVYLLYIRGDTVHRFQLNVLNRKLFCPKLLAQNQFNMWNARILID